MKTEWTPRNLTITAGGLVAALVLLPNLDKGWAVVRYITDAFPAAYAGKELSQDVRSDFDRYLEAQEQSNKQQAAVAEAINAYVQQQQTNQPMNQATDAPLREWDAQEGTYWCCPTSDRERCYAEQLWYRCR